MSKYIVTFHLQKIADVTIKAESEDEAKRLATKKIKSKYKGMQAEVNWVEVKE